MWSRNGHELFFEDLDNHIMVAAYTVQGDSFAADKPRAWSEKQVGGAASGSRNADLTPDGKRIAALKAPGTGQVSAVNKVSFVFNFFDEIRRKVSPGK